MTLSLHLAASAMGSVAGAFPQARQLDDPRHDGAIAQAAGMGRLVQTGPGHIGQAGESHDPAAGAGLGGSQPGDPSGLPRSVPGFDASDPDHRSQGTGPLGGLGMGGGMTSAPGGGGHDPDGTGHDAGPSGMSGTGNGLAAHDLPGDISAAGPGLAGHMPGGPIGGFDNHGHVGHGLEGTTTHQSGPDYVPGAGVPEPSDRETEGSPSGEALEATDEATLAEIGRAIEVVVQPPSDAGNDAGRPAPDDDHGGGNAGMPAPDDDSGPHNPAASSAMPAPEDDGSGAGSGSVLHNPAAFGAMPSPDDDGTGPHNPAALSAIPAPDDNNPGGPAGLAASAEPSHGATFWDSAAHAIVKGAQEPGISTLAAGSGHAAFEGGDHGRTATGLSMADLAHGSDTGLDHAGFEPQADLGASHAVAGDHAAWAATDLNPQPIPPEAHGHGFEVLQIH